MGLRESTLEDLEMSAGFWHGRRVLVTGHTGFKGSWLSLWLTHLGARVTGYSLPPPTDPSLFKSAGIAEGMTSLTEDVRDFSSLSAALLQHRPEVVFHLAAQSLVRYSYTNPRETYETNVMGTVNLLDAIRKVGGVRAVVIVTSDKCYENREWIWGYREAEPMGGHDPYSSSKGCAELVTAAFRNSFFNPSEHARHGVAIASARAGNVIGGGDWSEDRLIPDVMRAVRAGKPARVRNPAAIRPWQHVLEPLSGYLLVAERLCESGANYACAWNFGPPEDEARTVSWIADRLVQKWGKGASWESDSGNHPHEANYLKLDSSKARAHLGWRPRLRLDSALDSLIDWYRADAEGGDMKQYTLKQIQAYTQTGMHV